MTEYNFGVKYYFDMTTKYIVTDIFILHANKIIPTNTLKYYAYAHIL